VTIDHAYQGDLTVKLLRVGQPGEVVLQQADAASGPFGSKSYTPGDFVDQDGAGTWRLVAIDEAAQDEGSLMGWSLEITR
jgi:subtilisin-like proprotein convertase family protein